MNRSDQTLDDIFKLLETMYRLDEISYDAYDTLFNAFATYEVTLCLETGKKCPIR